MKGYTFSKATSCCLYARGVSFVIFVAALVFFTIPSTITAGTDVNNFQPVTNEMLLSSQDDPETWLMYGRDYKSWRYSELTQVNTENVKKLVPKWAFQIGTQYDKFECTPLVVNGIMIITTPYSSIYAVDARTGKELWRYDYPLQDGLAICCGMVNRGAAILGDKIFWTTLDAHLLGARCEDRYGALGSSRWRSNQRRIIDGCPVSCERQSNCRHIRCRIRHPRFH